MKKILILCVLFIIAVLPVTSENVLTIIDHSGLSTVIMEGNSRDAYKYRTTREETKLPKPFVKINETEEEKMYRYYEAAVHGDTTLEIRELYNEAMDLMDEKKYVEAADIFSKAIAKREENNAEYRHCFSTWLLAQAMIAHYRAGLYERGKEIELKFANDTNSHRFTLYQDVDNVYYKIKDDITLVGAFASIQVENAMVDVQEATVDTMMAYNVDLSQDSAQSRHIEAQVRVDSLTIEKQHRNLGDFHAGSRYLDDNLAFIQMLINIGEYATAEDLCLHSLDVIYHFDKFLPQSYGAQACYFMALIDENKGDWQHMQKCVYMAGQYYQETEDFDVLSQLFVLMSEYYQHFYQHQAAFQWAEDAATIYSYIPLEQRNPDKTFHVYMNLVKCLYAIGDYDECLSLIFDIKNNMIQNLGEQHINVALANMEFLRHPDLYMDYIDYAISLFDESQDIMVEHKDELLSTDNLSHIFGKDYVDLYTIGSKLFSDVGSPKDAEACIDFALRYAEKYYGSLHPYIISPAMQQTRVYLANGHLKNALHNIKLANRVARNAYGPYHWTVGETQWLIAQCELALKHGSQFELYADSVVQNFKHNIRHEFTFLTSAQRANYWEQQNKILDAMSAQALRHATPKMRQLAYDITLLKKGMLLKTQTDIFDIVNTSGDEVLLNMYMDLLQLNDQQRLAAERNLPFTNEQEEQKEYLEQMIQARVLEYGDYTQAMSIRWQEVKNALNKNETAIEFASIPISKDSTIYAALLLNPKSKAPKLIPLFEEKEALSMWDMSDDWSTNDMYSEDSNGRKFSKLIWSKLLPHLKKGETVYLAATGLLHQLAIEALPYDDNHSMADIFNLVRVSSTREIVTRHGNTNNTTAVLYGGIQYDVTADTLLAQSQQYATMSLLASRGIDNDTTNRGTVDYLPGTKIEAESIQQILENNNVQVQLFTSTNANEESFKALSGMHQNILHIGTHGFFWTDSTAQKKDYFSQRMIGMDNAMSAPPTIDPLNRCGLLFAGANLAMQGHSADLPEGVQDGILTAKEISLLDLRDADLVVLSACETGKGEITGDGVFGLQRAFKMAGARTIIMSLWPVSDQATQLFMTEFFRYWITNGLPKREAFRKAQNQVRQAYGEPIYWAGFIMLD